MGTDEQRDMGAQNVRTGLHRAKQQTTKSNQLYTWKGEAPQQRDVDSLSFEPPLVEELAYRCLTAWTALRAKTIDMTAFAGFLKETKALFEDIELQIRQIVAYVKVADAQPTAKRVLSTPKHTDRPPRELTPESSKVKITKRECEIMRYLSQGRTQQGTAILLHLSPRTVYEHTARLRAKLDVATNTEALYLLQRGKLI